jgi:ABC-type uncharacterized transport system permease subunit
MGKHVGVSLSPETYKVDPETLRDFVQVSFLKGRMAYQDEKGERQTMLLEGHTTQLDGSTIRVWGTKDEGFWKTTFVYQSAIWASVLFSALVIPLILGTLQVTHLWFLFGVPLCLYAAYRLYLRYAYLKPARKVAMRMGDIEWLKKS